MFGRPIAVGKGPPSHHIQGVPAQQDRLRAATSFSEQLTQINEYPYRRDCAPAHLCDYLASGRRQDHTDLKLLLFGGAIQLAGEVKARGERRRVRSDRMAVEHERGISVSSAVTSFEHEGLAFNLLDAGGLPRRDHTRQPAR
jgi:hypothetical protein